MSSNNRRTRVMMKFNWYEDRHPQSESVYNNTLYSAIYVPTVDEVNEVLAPMYADTVLQILRGQAIYFGYEVERELNQVESLERRVKQRNKDIQRATVIRVTKRKTLSLAQRRIVRVLKLHMPYADACAKARELV